MTEQPAAIVAAVTNGVEEFYRNLAAGGFVNELCLPQAWLADFLGLSPGTVRNWSSSGGMGRLFRRRLAELCVHQRHVAQMWAVALRIKRVLDGDPLSYLAYEDYDPVPRGLQPPDSVPDAVRALCASQGRLADVLGVHPSTLRNWKAGLAQPRPKAYAQLANGLDSHAWHLWAAASILDRAYVEAWVAAQFKTEER